MKKTIFLFWLFLMIFGAVSVKAQVRIGGASAPDPSAVLDLNPGETVEATGGLLFPKVRLASETDNTVFGNNVSPVRGLVVYNLNESGDYTRPCEGIYRHNGTKWIAVSVDNDNEERIYLSVTKANDAKQLWIGANGEREKTLKADVSIGSIHPNNVIDSADIKYRWTLSTAGSNPIIKEYDTEQPELVLNRDLFSSVGLQAIYNVKLTVRYHWTKKELDFATVIIGTGAWIDGGKRWLWVANTNLGADDILLNEQVGTEDPETSDRLGYYFQWARNSHIVRSTNINVTELSSSDIRMEDGQPQQSLSNNVFLKGNSTGDWRFYPQGNSSVNPSADWVWKPNATSSQTPDPCRKIKGGKWRVPTVDDWNNILASNDVRRVSGEEGRHGVAVNVKDDMDTDTSSGNLSFFLPETKTLNTEGEYEMKVGYWLNSNSPEEGHAWAISSNNEATKIKKAYGLNIRCVLD